MELILGILGLLCALYFALLVSIGMDFSWIWLVGAVLFWDRSRAQVYCSSFDRDRKRTENRSDRSFCGRASDIYDRRRVYRQPDVRRTEGESGLYDRSRGTGAWRKTEQSTEAASGEGDTGVGTLRKADPAFVRRTGRRREHYGSRVYEAIFGGKGYSRG